MILDIDAGNSRLKWRLIHNAKIASCGIEYGSLQEMLNHLVGEIDDICLDRIRLAHVLGVDGEIEMQVFFKKKFNILIEVAKSTDRCGEVVNQYKPPERLGVDRWLAILAAFREIKKKCCVIDCGSAITVDFVLNEGAYVGGYIVPGLKTLALALSQNTKQLPFVETYRSNSLSIGQSTNQAINNGALVMIVSFIEKVVSNFFDNKNEIQTVFLTGGDAEIIAQHAAFGSGAQVKLVPSLVIDGLPIALP
jgi:type III pantothenate kinase